MTTHDPRLIAALRDGNYVATSRGELRQAGTKVADVELCGMTITCDRTQTTRRQCSGAIAGFDGLLPTDPTIGRNRTMGDGTIGGGTFGDFRRRVLMGLLAVRYTELWLFWTATLPDGTAFELDMGHYFINQAQFTHDKDGVKVAVSGYGVTRAIDRAGWERPFVIAGGTTGAAAITAIVNDRVPGVLVDAAAASRPLPRQVLGASTSSSPLKDIVAIAEANGCEVFENAAGTVVVAPVVSLLNVEPADSAWTFNDGETGVVCSFVRTEDDADLINTVVVTSSHTLNKQRIRAIAQDNDPNSPYRPGRVGVLPLFVSSNLITDMAQAQNMANSLLHLKGGLVETMEVVCPPLPLDIVGRIARVKSRELGSDDYWQIDRIVFDCSANAASSATLSRRV